MKKMDSAVHESLSPFQVPWWRWTVITASVAALGVLLWLGSLPRDLQARDASWALPCVLAGFWLVYMARPVRRRLRVFWLARAPGMEAEGPFTVAQLVALWKLGQITAEGHIQPVSAEDGRAWQPLSRYADAWDESLSEGNPRSFSLLRVFAALGLVVVLAAILAVMGDAGGKNSQFIREAKRYVEAKAKDPSSVVYNQISSGESDSMTVIVVDWTGANSFGGKVRSKWRFGFGKPHGALIQVMDETTGNLIQ